MRISGIVTLLLCISVCFVSCDKELQADKDDKLIQDYLAENNIDATETSTGLYYYIEKEGNGSFPDINSTITVNYKGYLLNNTVFDQSDTNNPSEFKLANTIDGWREGIPKLSVGGKGKLFIPSRIGYGSVTMKDIPANSVLVFDIELISFYN